MPVIIAGALMGVVFFAMVGAGLLLGLLAGALGGCVAFIRVLTGRIDALSSRLDAVEAAGAFEAAPAATPVTERIVDPVVAAPEAPAPVLRTAEPSAARPVSGIDDAASLPRWQPAPPQPREPSPLDHVIAAVRDYFTTGNVVARVGGVILFFGLAFLLKYASDRNFVPIQVRLAGVWAGGIALLAAGWRLRKRGVYGAILQGTGVGTLYLTTYVALHPYALIPEGSAFALMVGVVVLSGWLALLQDSRALATIGTLGGFLAPILTSSGEGSHVVLFSYYALLNLGILGVAWRRAWRELNLMGFAFTFVIASIWGWQAYRTQHYATTQPFLAFHWALYLAIPVLFALRRRSGGIGYLDGTLVFGVPTAAFALQAAIAEDFTQGPTISALVAAAVYLAVARVVHLRGGEALRPLRESFTALGVAFATIAVPLAFDGSWLAATWALEGAALVWVGTRERRRLALAAGLGLQLLATAGAITAADEATRLPVLNGPFLSSATLGIAGILSALFISRRREAWPGPQLEYFVLGWGLLWWLGAGVSEVGRHANLETEPHLVLLFVTLTALALDRASARLRWTVGSYPAMGLVPVIAVMVLGALEDGTRAALLTAWGAAAWVTAGAVHLALLRWREGEWNPRLVSLWHAAGLVSAIALLARESAWVIDQRTPAGFAWVLVAGIAVPAAAIYLLPLVRAGRWPLGRFPAEYRGIGLMPMAAGLAVWTLGVTLRADSPAPLPYLPILHPLELGQAVVLFGLLRWWKRVRGEPVFAALPASAGPLALGMLAFLAINGVLARSVHTFGQLPYTVDALFGSRIFHAGLSILWSVLAMGVMVYASRRLFPALWFTGSGLLALVVVKLFLVELSGSGTVARIVSFLAVGLLMLLIGYLAPMPPREPEPELAPATPLA